MSRMMMGTLRRFSSFSSFSLSAFNTGEAVPYLLPMISLVLMKWTRWSLPAFPPPCSATVSSALSVTASVSPVSP